MSWIRSLLLVSFCCARHSLREQSIRVAHSACAALTCIHAVFRLASLPNDHTFFLQPKKEGKECRSPIMFFIPLFVRFRPSFAPRFKHFKLVNHTSLMISTQSRLPCRAVQLGEAVCLKNPILPLSGIFAYILLL